MDDGVEGGVEQGRLAVELARAPGGELAPALAVLGYGLYLQGRTDESRPAATEALSRPEAPDRPHAFALANAVLAMLDLEEGHAAQAERRARDAFAAAQRAGAADATSGILASVAVGHCAMALGRMAEAERVLARAERLASAEANLIHAHTLLRLAECHAHQGREALARSELDAADAVMRGFPDCGRLPAMVAAAREQVADAEQRHRVPVQLPSDAELAVLRLLATDLSQRQIGERLYLSVNTVKTHARSVYRKLGVASREDAVTRARSAGLLGERDSPG
jgi:LuxR family maltose regulon positive regulatory protein